MHGKHGNSGTLFNWLTHVVAASLAVATFPTRNNVLSNGVITDLQSILLRSTCYWGSHKKSEEWVTVMYYCNCPYWWTIIILSRLLSHILKMLTRSKLDYLSYELMSRNNRGLDVLGVGLVTCARSVITTLGQMSTKQSWRSNLWAHTHHTPKIRSSSEAFSISSTNSHS